MARNTRQQPSVPVPSFFMSSSRPCKVCPSCNGNYLNFVTKKKGFVFRCLQCKFTEHIEDLAALFIARAPTGISQDAVRFFEELEILADLKKAFEARLVAVVEQGIKVTRGPLNLAVTDRISKTNKQAEKKLHVVPRRRRRGTVKRPVTGRRTWGVVVTVRV